MISSHSFRPLLLILPLSLVATTQVAHAQSLWTVGSPQDPGVDFTSIQAAIDSAADGDVIRVNFGSYAEDISIDQKSIVLEAEFFTELDASISITNLTSSQFVAVQGFSLIGLSAAGQGSQGAVSIEDCAGAVQLNSLWVRPSLGHAFVVDNSTNVVLSSVTGEAWAIGFGPSGEFIPSDGLVVRNNSHVWVSGGFDGSFNPGGAEPLPGGVGVRVENSTLYSSGVKAKGGTGWSNHVAGCLTNGGAGAAFEITADPGQTAKAHLVSPDLLPGTNGIQDPCAPPLPPPPTLVDPQGLASQSSATPRQMVMGQFSSTGEYVTTVLGEPGDIYWTYLSLTRTGPVDLAGIEGVLYIDPSTSFLGVADVLPDDGEPTFYNYVHAQPPQVIFGQTLVLGSDGGLFLTNPGYAVLVP